MKTQVELNKDFSVSNTIIKLAFVSGILVSCMYGILLVFASAFKILG